MTSLSVYPEALERAEIQVLCVAKVPSPAGPRGIYTGAGRPRPLASLPLGSLCRVLGAKFQKMFCLRPPHGLLCRTWTRTSPSHSQATKELPSFEKGKRLYKLLFCHILLPIRSFKHILEGDFIKIPKLSQNFKSIVTCKLVLLAHWQQCS